MYPPPLLPTATETSEVMMKAVARLAPERGAAEGPAAETAEGSAEPKMKGPVAGREGGRTGPSRQGGGSGLAQAVCPLMGGCSASQRGTAPPPLREAAILRWCIMH